VSLPKNIFAILPSSEGKSSD